MAIKTRQTKAFLPEIESMMVDELTVGGDAVDRATVYAFTHDYTPERLQALRNRVLDRAMRFYEDLRKVQLTTDRDMESTRRMCEGMLKGWLSPWGRFAGRMEYEMDQAVMSGNLDYDIPFLARSMDAFRTLPEAAQFPVDKFDGFVFNRCAEHFLDYTKLPERYRRDDLEKSYREQFPWLVGSEHDRVLKDFRALCVPSKDDPDTREYRLFRPFVIQDDIVTGIRVYAPQGGPVSDYVVFRERDMDGQVMMPVKDLPAQDRRTVIERLSDILKYVAPRQDAKKAGRLRTVSQVKM